MVTHELLKGILELKEPYYPEPKVETFDELMKISKNYEDYLERLLYDVKDRYNFHHYVAFTND